MSLSRLLAWCLGSLIVLAAVAVLLARGMARPAYSPEERAAIDGAWQRVLELATVPPAPPADVPVAADFVDALLAFDADGDAQHLQPVADWLAGDGPHRHQRPQAPPVETWTLPLLNAGQHLAREADPAVLPGLLELAHALRTEGHVLDLMVGAKVSLTVLDRLAAAPDDPALVPVRGAAPSWAPGADEVQRTLARDALALVAELESGGMTITSHGGLAPTTTVTGELPSEVLATALRKAALSVLDSGRPPPRAGAWDALAIFLFGDPTLVERQLATLIAPSRGSLESTHGDLRRRWSDVLGAPPGAGPGSAVEAPVPPADGPPGG